MARVVIVEPDATLRWTLEMALKNAGHTVMAVDDMALALNAVAVSEYPLVVLVGEAANEAERARTRDLMALAWRLPPHAYVMLSMRPGETPQFHDPYTGQLTPLIITLCDIDSLIDAVDDAARRLAGIYPLMSPSFPAMV